MNADDNARYDRIYRWIVIGFWSLVWIAAGILIFAYIMTGRWF